MDRVKRHSFLRTVLVPLACVSLLIAWTWALLTPIPKGAVEVLGGTTASFLFAKTLHVSVYATLAFLVVLLPLRRNYRLISLALIVLHGATTEYLQRFVESRTSSFRDFGLDTCGALLGTLVGVAALRLSRRNWRREQSQVSLQSDAGGKNAEAADLG